MRVVFYDCGFASLGIQYLLRVCKDCGHDVDLFYDNSFAQDYLAQDFPLRGLLSLSPEQVCREIMSGNPQVVCFSMFTNGYEGNLRILQVLKKMYPEVIVICGGVHVTLLPHVVLENNEIDFAVVGEAETSLPALLEALASAPIAEVRAASRAQLPGVWNLVNGEIVDRGLSPIVHDLDRLPFPEKKMHVAANPGIGGIYTIAASRGCFFKCKFCNMPTINKIYKCHEETLFRLRSVDNVMAELHQAIREFKPRHIEFYDDCFGSKSSWLKEFCSRYKSEVNLPFGIQTSPRVHDAATLDLLADAGLRAVEYGFQAVNTSVRNILLNRHETNEEVLNVVHHARKKGMFVELDLIMNLPDETPQHLKETIAFVQDARPNWVNLSFLQYLPLTELTQSARATGLITDEELRKIERGQRISSYRLLSKSNLTAQYRILPYQVFFALGLPKLLSTPLIEFVAFPPVRSVCSFFASYFIYASRTFVSIFDRRDVFLRRQIARAFYALMWVWRKKKAMRSQKTAL